MALDRLDLLVDGKFELLDTLLDARSLWLHNVQRHQNRFNLQAS